MPYNPPPMSPIRCFTGGVPVDSPSPIRSTAVEVEARHTAAAPSTTSAALGTAQAEQEAARLTECYARGLAGIESQVAHEQNQRLLAELVRRQEFRAETGQTYLTPVTTQVHLPEPPAVEPAPAPALSPMAIVLDGTIVEQTAAPMSADPGTLQRQQEQAYRAMNMEEAGKVSYVNAEGKTMSYTPADRARQQQTENAYAAREAWREAQGQDYCPTELEWLRGDMQPTFEAPAADEA